MEFQKMPSRYLLVLTYEELNAIYHAVGNYGDMLNSMLGCHMGLFLTDNELKLFEKSRELTTCMREIEPKLYYDLSFEK